MTVLNFIEDAEIFLRNSQTYHPHERVVRALEVCERSAYLINNLGASLTSTGYDQPGNGTTTAWRVLASINTEAKHLLRQTKLGSNSLELVK